MAVDIKNISLELQNLGAKDGARRIEIVAQQLQYFTIEGASQYIRKEEIIDEIEEQGDWKLRALHGARNFLSVAPIAFTWAALHWAADAYAQDLGHNAGDLYQPFLLLWQQGFHGTSGFVIPFSLTALIDALVLTSMVLLVLYIPKYERNRRKDIRASLGNFDAVIDGLLLTIRTNGANAHLADSDIQKISKAIEATLQKVLLNYDRVAGEAREFVKNTNQSTQSLVKNFEDNLVVFNSDVKLLTHNLQKMDNNLDSNGQKLTELTNASSKLVGSSNDLALNAKSMANSANQSSQASQGISMQLGALNTTQQDIIKAQQQVANVILQSQKQATDTIVKSQQQVTNTIAQSQQQVTATITQTQGEMAKQFTATQQNVVQEIKSTQNNIVQGITGVANTITQSQQQVTATIAQTQGEMVKQFATTQQNVVQEIKSTQNNVVQGITSVADHMEDSTKNTRDVAKDLENVVQGLKNMTPADFQIITTQVSNIVTQVNHVADSLNKVNQQIQDTTTALANATTSFNTTTTLLANIATPPSQPTKRRWQFWKP
jgi:hypothetical protein